MRLALLGATGRVGNEVLSRALDDRHKVTVLVRSPGKITGCPDNLTVRIGDACNQEDVFEAVRGADAVFSALSTDGGTVLTVSTPMIIAAMIEHNVRKVVTIGTAGILQSSEHPELLRYESPDSRRSSARAAEEHRRAWELIAASGLDWTVVCPTFLPAGERLGQYRVKRDFLPQGGTSISVADTADFAYRQLFSDQYVGCRAGITY